MSDVLESHHPLSNEHIRSNQDDISINELLEDLWGKESAKLSSDKPVDIDLDELLFELDVTPDTTLTPQSAGLLASPKPILDRNKEPIADSDLANSSFNNTFSVKGQLREKVDGLLDRLKELPTVRDKASGLLGKISLKRPERSMSVAPEDSGRRKLLRLGAIGAGAVVLGVVGGPMARAALQTDERSYASANSKTAVTTATPPSPSSSLNVTTTEAPVTSTTEIPMSSTKLDIEPKPSFLTPEGALETPDYTLVLPTVGSTILGFERPASEADRIEDGVNTAVTNTLTAAQTPQVTTPQVAEYKKSNPDFVPTAERGIDRGKKWDYWKGLAAGAYQKTALRQHGDSVYPGQRGNSFFMAHASFYNAGAGDLAALKPNDPLYLTRSIDGNKYTFVLVEREIIDVDRHGNLTRAERDKQSARGYGQDGKPITFQSIAQVYKGYEDQPTITIQACGNLDGTPGGKPSDGSSNNVGAGDARVLYRFKLTGQEIHKRYPA